MTSLADRVRDAAVRTVVVEAVPGGAVASASFDKWKAEIVWVAPPGSPLGEIMWDARNAVMASLLLEVVRNNLGTASDGEITAALYVARNGGDREIGDVELEAARRGLLVSA